MFSDNSLKTTSYNIKLMSNWKVLENLICQSFNIIIIKPLFNQELKILEI